MTVDVTERYPRHFANVLGKRMAYVETGEGDPIVFLHGSPTSSYIWRNIIPHVEDLGRCIAPDPIGMGDSDKLDDVGPDSYRLVGHRHSLDALLETLDVRDRVTLVVHDWGSALGFDWANRHREAVRGLVYMEAIVRPITCTEFPDEARSVFEGFRSPAGEGMVLTKNIFVERVLPGSVLHRLTEPEMDVYRTLYLEQGKSRPHAHLAASDPDRRRAQGRRDRRSVRGVAAEHRRPEAVRRRRPGRDPEGGPARVLSLLAEPGDGHGTGGHFIQEDSSGPDRACYRRLAPEASLRVSER